MEELLKSIYNSITSTEVDFANGVFRLILSTALGMLIGFERKRKGQIAGVRTFAIISMGACLAMLLSIYVPQVYLGLKNGDPGRIAAQVITGVGFLGGGAMIHLKGAVRGLTTAAGIWLTATIGMAVGVGMYWCAIAATAMILIVLASFEVWEQRRNIGQENRSLRLTIYGIISDIEPYKQILCENSIILASYFIRHNYEKNTTELNFIVMAPSHHDYLPIFAKLRDVAPTKELTLTSPA